MTTLTTSDSGQLAGSYEFSDKGETTRGALRQHQRGEDDTYTLVWTDEYGTGQLVVQFDQSRNAFTGKWGYGDDTPRHHWNGTRCDEDVASL